MALQNRLAAGFAALFRGRRADAELDDELREYLEAAVEQKVEDGMRREDALRAARVEMGSAAAVKDWVRDVGWESRVETVWQDVRYAFRLLRLNPGFAAVVVATLALGIGVNTALFSLVDAVLLKPMPFRDPERLVEIRSVLRKGAAEETIVRGMTRERLADWREERHIFEGVEAERGLRMMRLGETDTSIGVAQVSPGVFPLLGVGPALGRPFVPEDSETGQALLLSDGFWKRAFGAEADIINRTVVLDGRTFTIVGVMPPGVRFPFNTFLDAWIPLSDAIDPLDPSSRYVGVVAKLREGVALDSVQPALDAAAVAIQRNRPERESWGADITSIDPRVWLAASQPLALIAFGAAMFVLLTACANVASLLLARSSSRQRELAIRAAFGAGRARLARQLLVESLVLSAIGGATAALLAWWLVGVIPSVLPPRMIVFLVHGMTLGWRVLAFAAGTTVAVGLLTGTLPAFRGSLDGSRQSPSTSAATRGDTPRNRRAGRMLLTAQVAFAMVLLTAAGLLATSFGRMLSVDYGYRAEELVGASVSIPLAKYPTLAHQRAYFDQLFQSVQTMPGIEEAAMGRQPANDGGGRLVAEGREADPDAAASACILFAGESYFDVLGIRIVEGRPFTSEDRQGSAPVVVIDQEAAQHFWPGQSALGKRVRYSPLVPWSTVVGVARDVKTSRVAEARDSFEVYLPVAQQTQLTSNTFIVRTTAAPEPIVAAIRARVQTAEPDARIASAGRLDELYEPGLVRPRFAAMAMSLFALLALLTAAVGLYGTLSYGVSQRTREIGVRMALGADAPEIRRLVMFDALWPVFAGMAVGLLAAQWLSRYIEYQLYEVTPRDPQTLLLVACAFLVVAWLAAYLPARRATRVDPLVALKAE